MTNPRILIVDDEENILSSLKRLFRKEPYQILTARSGEEGLKILDDHQVDLIISDLKMPQMNGIEFLKRAKEKNPVPLRIVLTGHADLRSIIDAIDQGEIYRFLLKPWDDEELKMTIRQALDYYHLWKENRTLVRTVKKQSQVLQQLEKEHPGISVVERDENGTIVLTGKELTKTVDELIQKYEEK
ncbi:MAG: response regulator [candidate division Zixibacteria bacterium]|nr:response regulator [candidate division Zixibacteria bacterium]